MNDATKYTISHYDAGSWIWDGDGDTANGTAANLPDAVHDLADSGEEGDIEVDGVKYRVEHI